MKIVLDRKGFVGALSIGGAFAGRNRIVPIFEKVKIKVSNGALSVISSDGDNYVNRRMMSGVDADGDASFCVSLHDTMSYVKSLGDDIVELDVLGGDLVIRGESGEFKMHCDDGDKFPTRGKETDSARLRIPSNPFVEWVDDARRFVSSDTLRPVMCGVNVYRQGSEFGVCATDGISLFTASVDDAQSGDDFSVTLDQRCLKTLRDSFLCDDGSLDLMIGKSSVTIKSLDTTLLCALSEGRFPNFKSLLSGDSGEARAVVPRKSLIDSLRRCQVGSSLGYVSMSLKDGAILLESVDVDMGKRVTESVAAQTSGSIDISFKLSSIIDIIDTLGGETVSLSMECESKPCFFREDPCVCDKIAMLMPVRIER